MKISDILTLLPIIGQLAAPSSEDSVTIPSNNFRELTLDPHGFIDLASDGIARSYNADGNVIDHHVLAYGGRFGHITQDVFDQQSKYELSHNQTQSIVADWPFPNPVYWPRCLGMYCYSTDSCRVRGCYACIQTQNQWRERTCIVRPYWYGSQLPSAPGVHDVERIGG